MLLKILPKVTGIENPTESKLRSTIRFLRTKKLKVTWWTYCEDFEVFEKNIV